MVSLSPVVYQNNIYMPVRWASHVLGKDINWDGFQKAVYIGEYLTDIRSVNPMPSSITEFFLQIMTLMRKICMNTI